MFDLNYWSNLFSSGNLIPFFFKISGIVFSLVLLVYTFVILRQTQIMARTVEGKNNPLIILISFIGIIIALVILFFALFLI